MPIRLLVASFIFFAASLAAAQTTRPTYIAVVSSFPEELASIEQKLRIDPAKLQRRSIHGVEINTGELNGQPVLFLVTGMSLVNAAMNTQIALDRFEVASVLFTGIAGGVDPSLNAGDVVIPQRWHYHSEAAYFNEASPGKFALADYSKPKYPNFGMIFPEEVTVRREAGDWHHQPSFDADEKLLAIAKAATASMPAMKFNERNCKVIVGGDGVSGTVFCDNAAYRKFVFEVWKAECLDMESTAIVHVCWQNQKPCLIVRGLSDLAGGQAGKNTVDEYLKSAADNSATVLAAILQQLTRH